MLTPPPLLRERKMLELMPIQTQGDYIKSLIESGDLENLQLIMGGEELLFDYSGHYYNSRQALSWRLRLDTYMVLVTDLFSRFSGHSLEVMRTLPEDLTPYRGRYILDSTALEAAQPDPTVLTAVTSSSELLFYINDTGEREPVFIKNCARLKKRLGDFNEGSMALSQSQFQRWITDNGGHTKPADPNRYATEDLETLKTRVFASTQAECIPHFMDVFKETANQNKAPAGAYINVFTEAWMGYMKIWLQDQDLATIQQIPDQQTEKWNKIMQEADTLQREYQVKRSTGAHHFIEMNVSLAAATPTQHRQKISPLTPLDTDGTTAFHLALRVQNKALIEMLMTIISAQKSELYEIILAKTDDQGKTIATLLEEMGDDGPSLKAALEICCKSTPVALTTPARSIFSPETSRSSRPSFSSAFSGPIPFHLPLAAPSPEEMLKEIAQQQATPVQGPYKSKDKIEELAFKAIDFHDLETLKFLMDSDTKLRIQQEINAHCSQLISEGHNQVDYPLDLLHVWHLRLEHKFYKLLDDRLHSTPAPDIHSNEDLLRIRGEAFAELEGKAVELFFKYDRQRKYFFKEQEAALTPIIQKFFEAFCLRELALSTQVIDERRALEHNITAVTSLSNILKEKAKEHVLARQACPSFEEATFLAASPWMQAWQQRRTEEGRPLPFVVDMTENALNSDLACLIDAPPVSLLCHDKFGNTLLHRALWTNDSQALSFLLDQAQAVEALKCSNHYDMTPKQVAEYQEMPEALFTILCLSATESRVFSEEDTKLFKDLSQFLGLYSDLKQATHAITEYRDTEMPKKQAIVDKLTRGNFKTRFYCWLSKMLSGKDEAAIARRRSTVFADLESVLHPEPTLHDAASLRAKIPNILEIPEVQGNRLTQALSPIMEEQFGIVSSLSPRLKGLAESARNRARVDTDSPIPFDHDWGVDP